MLVIDAGRARDALPFDTLVPALRRAFAEGCEVPLRHAHTVQGPQARGTVLIMPAWNADGFLGIKTVNIYPQNRDRALPGLHSVYMLFDANTGVPLAQIDGNEITSRRTAAAAALGADFLARPDASRLLVVGSGRVASLVPAAMRAVREIGRVDVWNINPASARTLVERLREEGVDAHLATELEAAVRAADIVSCATLAEAPLVRGAWLRPGTHLDLIGSFTPAMKEADVDCFAAGSVFVDTEEAPMKAGDLLDAFASGRFAREGIRATLAELCRGGHAGRADADEITVFKAVGSALEDLAAASLIYRAARHAAA